MNRLEVHTLVPEGLPALTETDGALNVLRVSGGNSLELAVMGSGTVTIYVWFGDAVGWRKHPTGQDVQDDGSYARLVVGRRLSERYAYVCLVGHALTRAYVREARY